MISRMPTGLCSRKVSTWMLPSQTARSIFWARLFDVLAPDFDDDLARHLHADGHGYGHLAGPAPSRADSLAASVRFVGAGVGRGLFRRWRVVRPSPCLPRCGLACPDGVARSDSRIRDGRTIEKARLWECPADYTSRAFSVGRSAKKSVSSPIWPRFSVLHLTPQSIREAPLDNELQ